MRLHIRVHLTLGELSDLRVGTGGKGGVARTKSAAAWGADDAAAEAKLIAAASAGGGDPGEEDDIALDDEEEEDEDGVEGDDTAVAGSSFEGDDMTPGIVSKAGMDDSEYPAT